MSFKETALALSKSLREAERIPALARQLLPLAAQAGPEDKEVLAAILQALHIPADVEDAPDRGRALEGGYKVDGEKAGNELRKLAAAAHHRSAILSAEVDPQRIRVIDFAPNAVQIFTEGDQPTAKNTTVYGPYDQLRTDHPIRNQLSRGDCPTRDGKPVIFLGRPVQGLDERFYPAADYPVAQAISWSRSAGQQERQIEEKRKWDEEKAERERIEKAKKVLTPEQVTELIEGLQKQITELKAKEA